MANLDFTKSSVVTEFANTDEVYVPIPEEEVTRIFEGKTPLNSDGEPDSRYIEGEAQFIFDKKGNLSEILIFPVYEEEPEYFVNGDYIEAPDEYWQYKDEAKKVLVAYKEAENAA